MFVTAGVFAIRAGPPLRDNLLACLLKKDLVSHEPQTEFLGLISTGNKYAVASRGDYALEGAFLWTLKDKIDRTWMDGYTNLPSMGNDATATNDEIPPNLISRGNDALAAFAAAPMRCGGCGAKVGARTLSRVLNAVHQRRSLKCQGHNLSKIKEIDLDDAAVIMLPEKGGGAMVHTIDFFRSFISDPFIFGKIAAVHALSDCHAMGAKAQTALALAIVKFAAFESMTECNLIDMLSGACDILDDEGCELVGGHTCEGAEVALGFSINGFIEDPSKLLRKRGGMIGDKIVLTKPIGSGATFASDMRYQCNGEFVNEAVANMIASNGPASRIAMDCISSTENNSNGVHACTDVTGFGLAGHLLEMLIANDDDQINNHRINAVLELNAIPFLKGALEAASKNIFSSLQRENTRIKRTVSNHEAAVKSNPQKYPLIFDPQTAGGLLFFVSSDFCDEFVSKLSKNSETICAAVIGDITEYKETAASDNSKVCHISNGTNGNRLSIRL